MREFSQLSYHERQQIYTGLCEGQPKSMIAKRLDRSTSTIIREIARNSDRYGYSYPGKAHEKAKERKHINAPKIDRIPTLKDYIIGRLDERWSPNIIAHQWSFDHPEQSLCKETIYQWLYSDNSEKKIALRKLLVRSHKKRGMKVKKGKSKIKNRVSIDQRPDSINDRTEVGHFECDLIFNKGSQSKNICTLIERVTRKSFFIHNDNKLTKTVMGALIELIVQEKIPVKSITFDNGTEFADHTKLHKLNIATYFCDPGKPWQKGSIEHLNGMIRRYWPSDLSAAAITKEKVAQVNEMMDRMPRKILSHKTPLDTFNEAIKITKLRSESRMKLAQPAMEATCFQ